MKFMKKRGLRKAEMWKADVHKAGALFCILCVLCMLFTAVTPVKASQSGRPEQSGKPYSYKIRIYAGRQGTIGGGEVLVYDSVSYGSGVQFRMGDVQLFDNSKYYVRGLRKSGVDNSEAQQNPAFKVTEDQDYVVAYGILGDAVSYVINYQDQDGNTLAPSETYYGNVGDKPVIAYLYIEGYRPQAYNLTRTLSKNAAENVFTFIYTPISEGGAEPPDENQNLGGEPDDSTETMLPGGTGVVPPEALAVPGAGGAAAPAGPGGAAAPGPGGDAPGPGGVATPDENIPDENVPLDDIPDLETLDDEETPLANFFNIASEARILGIPAAAILIPTAVLIACFIWLILKKKKEKERERA